MRRWILVGALLMACGDADDGKITTAEDCKNAGGRVAPNPGAGVMCEADEEQIGTISEPLHFEAPICCRKK
jgi:hypothetical protein